MNDFHSRAYRPDDAVAVADLINIVADAGGGPGGFGAAAIEDAVTNEVTDPATDTRVITDGTGQLVAVGLVTLPPEGGDRVDLIGGVRPDRRGAGIGRGLLTWQRDRAAARHAEVAPDAAWAAQVVAGVADTSATRLYERFGFTVARYFLAMTAPTTPPLVGAPDGVTITPYRQDQEHRVYAVHAVAFRDLWGYQDPSFEAWAPLTVRSETFRPELARIATAGDAIAGYLLPYDTGIPGRLYIGQIGTAPSWRGRGIASSLLAEVLTAAGREGYTQAALDTDADNPTRAAGVYAKVGFVVDQHIVAYRRPV